MKILILNWRDPKNPMAGGAELVTMEHAKAWVQAGHTVTWVTSRFEGARSDDIACGVHIIRRFGAHSIYFFVPYYLIFYRNSYDLVIDEVHGFPFFSPLFTNKPVIVFIHEIAGEIWDYMFTFPKNMIGKYMEQLYLHVYKKNIFWTDAPSTVDELISLGIAKKNCIAIPCPIVYDTASLKQIRSSKIIGHRYTSSKHSKEKNPTYLFVSRVVRMKGIEEVIKAFSFILKEQKNAQLWIVGGGERKYVSMLQEMMFEYKIIDHVTFWGVVTESKKYDLMAKAHILLHASVKEGWGLVVLEAASVGTPSVVYNVPGLCDVVKNGKTGVVLGVNTPQTMAEAVLKLYTDRLRYALFQREGNNWVKSLTWPDVTKQSISLIGRIYEKKN